MLGSLDLLLRSEYFKTALNTSVGTNNKKVLKVEECSSHVLATVVDFIYGIGIPEDFCSEDAKSLLAMADLYLMEDLKDAVAPLLSKQLKTKNILQTSRMAEKYNALRLKEVCCDFILANIDALDNTMLDKLFAVMPMVGKACLQKQKKEYQGTELANKLLGVNLAELEPFKKRAEFRSRHDYSRYVWANI